MRLATVLIVIIGASVSGAAAASRLHDEPESAARMLDIDAAGTYQEELSGRDVTELRFYTTGMESLVTWRLGEAVFVYPVDGDSHLLRALALHRAMSEHGIATFVAETRGKRRQSLDFRRVTAVQVQAPIAEPARVEVVSDN